MRPATLNARAAFCSAHPGFAAADLWIRSGALASLSPAPHQRSWPQLSLCPPPPAREAHDRNSRRSAPCDRNLRVIFFDSRQIGSHYQLPVVLKHFNLGPPHRHLVETTRGRLTKPKVFKDLLHVLAEPAQQAEWAKQSRHESMF